MAQHFAGGSKKRRRKKRKRQNWLQRVVQYLNSPHMTPRIGHVEWLQRICNNILNKKQIIKKWIIVPSSVDRCGVRQTVRGWPGTVLAGGRRLTWEAVITGRVRVAACRLHVRLSLCGQHAHWGATPDWEPALWPHHHPSEPPSPPPPTHQHLYSPLDSPELPTSGQSQQPRLHLIGWDESKSSVEICTCRFHLFYFYILFYFILSVFIQLALLLVLLCCWSW